MKKISLGPTRETVSALCLGTMYFGTATDGPLSYRLLDQYAEAGGSFLDTANVYARWVDGCVGGESETLLGRWMQERHNRSSMFIATKVGFEMPGVPRGLTPELIERECDKSLRRLGVETIDLYYAHVDDRTTSLEETMTAFARLVKKGKVRYLGASNYLAWRLEETRETCRAFSLPEFVAIQQRHSYLSPDPRRWTGPQVPSNNDLLDYCRNRKLTLLAYSPLLGGAYTRSDRTLPEAYVNETNHARLEILRSLAREKGATANQLVLAWMLASNPMALPLVAASSGAQLAENLGALAIPLTADDLGRLNA